jgi:hypothetical protein
MSKENFNLEKAIKDSRGLPQLGVAPDLLIQLSENSRKFQLASKHREKSKDTLKWGFFSAVGAYIEGRFNSPQEQTTQSQWEKARHESLDNK